MKNIILSLFFTAYCVTSFSQSGYLKWFPSEKNNLITDAIELSDSNYIVIGMQQLNSTSNTQSYVAKIGKNGDLIQEKIGVLSDTSSSLGLFFRLPNEPNILYCGSSNIYEYNGHTQHFNTINTFSPSTLELSELRRFTSPPDTFCLNQSIAITDSALFFHSKICRNLPTFEPIGYQIRKYDLNLNQSHSFFDLKPSYYPDYIGVDSKNERLKYCFINSVNTCVKNFDFNLLPTSEQIVLPNTPLLTSFTKMSDSSFLITATERNSIAVDHIKIVKLNQNDLNIDSAEYYNHPDSILYGGISVNTAIVNDKIFVVGSKNLIPLQYPWQTTPTWLQITRLDTNMEILDHHFYGGDAVYMPYKIFKTLDGGAVVVGNRNDCFNSTSNILNTFILKVDKNGLISEITDNLNPISYSAIVFPNPGKEVLNLTSGAQLNHGMFTLYDMQGRPVLIKESNAVEMQFDTSQLTSGSYVWQIVRNNKVMDSGKWVKE